MATGVLVRILDALSLRKRRPDLPLISELLDLSSESRVLDIGGGAGGVTEALTGRNRSVVAIDPSRRKLVVGQKRRPRIAFAASRAENLPFRADAFDRVLGVVSFHHVGNPDTALEEIRRTLKPGGRIVLFEFHPPPQRSPSMTAFGRSFHGSRLDFFEPSRLRDLFEVHGFRDVSVRPGRRGYAITAHR